MKDIAERAGVSVTTVSHVLNKTRHRPVAKETRQRILQVVHELNYHTNASARRLARKHSELFGLVVSEIANPFFADVIKAFESAVLKKGFDLLLCNTEYDPDRTTRATRKLLENRVRGVAVVTSAFDGEHAQQLAAEKIPVVLFGPGGAQPWISRIDYTACGLVEAVNHLVSLGHKEVALVSGPERLRSATRICERFTEAMKARGIAPRRVVHCDFQLDAGVSAVHALLQAGDLPTAFVCAHDLIAMGVMSALEEAGFSVPEDFSVVGFNDVLFARLARPPLTTVHVPRQQLGLLAFDALQHTKSGSSRTFSIDTRLVVRKSTTAPPTSRSRSQSSIVVGSEPDEAREARS